MKLGLTLHNDAISCRFEHNQIYHTYETKLCHQKDQCLFCSMNVIFETTPLLLLSPSYPSLILSESDQGSLYVPY